MRRILVVLTLLALLAGMPARGMAQIAMPEGTALSPFAVSQSPLNCFVTGDLAGGLWGVFQGAAPNNGLWANHINVDGSYGQRFNASARNLAYASTSVNNVSVAPDGIGGVVVCWFGQSPRNPASPFIALRYLHISYEGTIDTPDTGIVVSTIATAASCTGDGAGGGYVVWEELRSTSNPDICAQRYNAAGVPQWTPINSVTGRNVCPIVGLQRLRAVQEDGTGGAYVLWADSRTTGTVPLYAARLLPSGIAGAPWTANGLRITPVNSGVRYVGSGSSSVNGLYVAWRDVASNTLCMGQHVLENGTLAWGAAGSFIALAAPSRADFIPGPGNDTYLTWGGADVRSMRIDANGNRLWPESAGRIIATPVGGAVNTRVASDGQLGQRIMWSFDNAGQTDVAVITVDSTAAPVAGQVAGGTVVESDLVNEDAIAWGAPTSAEPMIVWLEAGVLRARRLGLGTTDVDLPFTGRERLTLASLYPNPVRGASVTLAFHAPAGAARAEVYDITGRRVLEHAFTSTGGAQRVTLATGAAWAAGLYTVRLSVGHDAVTRRIVRTE